MPRSQPDFDPIMTEMAHLAKTAQLPRMLSGKAWQPSLKEWEIYRAVVEGQSVKAIAAEHKVTLAKVRKIRQRFDEWVASEYSIDVEAIRAQHTERLYHLYAEAMAGWRRSVGKVTVTTTTKKAGAEEVVTRVEHHAGNPEFLGKAAGFLRDIREIWAANVKQAPPPSTEDDRVAGRPREQAIQEQIERLRQSINEPSNN